MPCPQGGPLQSIPSLNEPGCFRKSPDRSAKFQRAKVPAREFQEISEGSLFLFVGNQRTAVGSQNAVVEHKGMCPQAVFSGGSADIAHTYTGHGLPYFVPVCARP